MACAFLTGLTTAVPVDDTAVLVMSAACCESAVAGATAVATDNAGDLLALLAGTTNVSSGCCTADARLDSEPLLPVDDGAAEIAAGARPPTATCSGALVVEAALTTRFSSLATADLNQRTATGGGGGTFVRRSSVDGVDIVERLLLCGIQSARRQRLVGSA